MPLLSTLNLSLPVPDKEKETVPSGLVAVVEVTAVPELTDSFSEMVLLASSIERSVLATLTVRVSETVLIPSVAVSVIEYEVVVS